MDERVGQLFLAVFHVQMGHILWMIHVKNSIFINQLMSVIFQFLE